jgi:hypothetical protein
MEDNTTNVNLTLEQLVMQSMRPFGPQSIRSLDEAIATCHAGKLTKEQADQLALLRGWVEC